MKKIPLSPPFSKGEISFFLFNVGNVFPPFRKGGKGGFERHFRMNIENKVAEIAKRLYSEAMNTTPSIFDKRKWEGKVLEWAMKDDHFKTQLFRFIDVLPSLKNDYAVIRILKECFSGESVDMLGIFKLGTDDIPERGLMAKAAARAIRTNIRKFARQFIAGG